MAVVESAQLEKCWTHQLLGLLPYALATSFIFVLTAHLLMVAIGLTPTVFAPTLICCNRRSHLSSLPSSSLTVSMCDFVFKFLILHYPNVLFVAPTQTVHITVCTDSFLTHFFTFH
eukprot:TRINITY_DN2171_c0_g1_i1.p1 TRINITY_DN2171_c0_g1~~TRINITY_DN2171_c0_g1_i1.p1  ORF type:complete len:116 (-),score=8.07 TRINITY_DN2171_c0_g1_i1:106-453(-)